MEGITIAPTERKDLICKMKRERRPSRRLRMHLVLLASEGYSATRIARTLFCSRTTVYSVVGRFVREGQKAFDELSMIAGGEVLRRWWKALHRRSWLKTSQKGW
jgi:DNA invertase Pin-like site-specific DNA recombinase